MKIAFRHVFLCLILIGALACNANAAPESPVEDDKGVFVLVLAGSVAAVVMGTALDTICRPLGGLEVCAVTAVLVGGTLVYQVTVTAGQNAADVAGGLVEWARRQIAGQSGVTVSATLPAAIANGEPNEVPGSWTQSQMQQQVAVVNTAIVSTKQCYESQNLGDLADVFDALDTLSLHLRAMPNSYRWNLSGMHPATLTEWLMRAFVALLEAVETRFGVDEAADPCLFNRQIVPGLKSMVCEFVRKVWLAYQSSNDWRLKTIADNMNGALNRGGLGTCDDRYLMPL